MARKHYKKDDGRSSFGVQYKKAGPQRMSRWTFWQQGFGDGQPLICSVCNKRVYKLIFEEGRKGICMSCKEKISDES